MKTIKLFPGIETVFAGEFEENKKHFMPLATIDLASIDASLTGPIHLVYYNDDPYCEETIEFLNDFCDEDKSSFDIIDGKYRFKADFGFFKTNDDWVEWLAMGKKSYLENSSKYQSEQHLEISEVIRNIGGEPEWAQDENWPINQQGEKLRFICQASSYEFVDDNCGEEIFLFYDKTNQMAVQIHQVD